MLDSGDVLKLDQEQLETVLPALGRKVKVVLGPFKGCDATLVSLDAENFQAKIQLESGPQSGSTVRAEYEEICKV